MTSLTTKSDGNTALSPEEVRDLIPNLATKEELNEWERENILRAREWALGDRTRALELAADLYVRRLHAKMFDQTWKWAGEYRHSEKNIGVPSHEIRERLMALFGDIGYWIEATFDCEGFVDDLMGLLIVLLSRSGRPSLVPARLVGVG